MNFKGNGFRKMKEANYVLQIEKNVLPRCHPETTSKTRFATKNQMTQKLLSR